MSEKEREMKVTVYYSETMDTDDAEDFDTYEGVESVVMHQSGCIHLSSERKGLVEVGVWVSGDDWTWATWEDDTGHEVVIHNAGEI